MTPAANNPCTLAPENGQIVTGAGQSREIGGASMGGLAKLRSVFGEAQHFADAPVLWAKTCAKLRLCGSELLDSWALIWHRRRPPFSAQILGRGDICLLVTQG